MNNYKSKIIRNINNTKIILSNWIKTLPYIKPFYAIKSCPDMKLLELCNEYNLGFDYASMNELKLIKSYNCETIYANPTKSNKDIEYSSNNGHHLYVVDSIEEIQKISNIDKKAKYIIRIKSNEIFSSIKFNSKFGISYDEFTKIAELMALNNLNIEGFSYHVGSKCSNMKAHTNTIHNIIQNLIPISINYGHKVKIIDIGGGFENSSQLLELDNEIKEIKKSIENNDLRLIAEPGRLFSNELYDLYVDIIAIRERIDNNIKTLYITINDSVYHTFQGKIYDGQDFEPIPLYNNNELVRCIIFGQTCDSIDVICVDKILPYPKIGDKLLFKNIGAYSIASCNGLFNGFQCGEIIDGNNSSIIDV